MELPCLALSTHLQYDVWLISAAQYKRPGPPRCIAAQVAANVCPHQEQLGLLRLRECPVLAGAAPAC